MAGKQVIAIAAVIIAAASCSPQPRLSVNDVCFMGDVYKEDSTLRAAVVLKNRGWKKLRITDVRPSCSCTRVDRTQMTIKPMSSETVRVNIDLTLLGPMDDIDETIGVKTSGVDTFTQIHVVFNLKYRNK